MLLYPTPVVLRDPELHTVLAIAIFVALLGVAFLSEWRRGALDWAHGRREADAR